MPFAAAGAAKTIADCHWSFAGLSRRLVGG
jgi:hypothetical protein